MGNDDRQLPPRLADLRQRIAAGTYRLDSWTLAQLLLAHPDAREALGLPPLITPRTSNLKKAG